MYFTISVPGIPLALSSAPTLSRARSMMETQRACSWGDKRTISTPSALKFFFFASSQAWTHRSMVPCFPKAQLLSMTALRSAGACWTRLVHHGKHRSGRPEAEIDDVLYSSAELVILDRSRLNRPAIDGFFSMPSTKSAVDMYTGVAPGLSLHPPSLLRAPELEPLQVLEGADRFACTHCLKHARSEPEAPLGFLPLFGHHLRELLPYLVIDLGGGDHVRCAHDEGECHAEGIALR